MSDLMKAITYKEYGGPEVLTLERVKKPTPTPNQIMIEVHAASVTAADVNLRGFTFVPNGMKFLARLMLGWFRPKRPILGVEVAGQVVEIGAQVTRFQVGDRVFGIDAEGLGGYAEYVCRDAEGSLAKIPDNASDEEAAGAYFGLGTALYFLKKRISLQPGQHVLVNGASGGTGHMAVQFAKLLGAEVTGVCSTRNVELVKELGADHVIDYTKEDFTTHKGRYDYIFDTVAKTASFKRCKGALKAGGKYLAVAGGLGVLLSSLWNKQIIAGMADDNKEIAEEIKALLEAGNIKPFIDRSYPLEEIVDAHRYADTGHKRGNVVITI